MLIQLAKRLFGEGATPVASSQIRELIACRRFEEARRLLPRLDPQARPAEVERLCLQAELAFHAGDDAQAQSLYRAALTKAPGFAEAHYGLSLIMAEAGQLESALEHVLFARTAAPSEPRFLAQLGYCYLRLEMYPAAEGPLRQALKLRPTDKHAWNNLGVVMRQRPHVAEAKACFLQALEIDPDNRLAQENLRQLDEEIAGAGWDAIVVDRRKEPTGDLTESAAEWGLPPDWALVVSHVSAGRRDEAIGIAEELAAAKPDDPASAVGLAIVYARNAEHDSALDVLKRCAESFPDFTQGRIELGKLLLMFEQPAAARGHFEAALHLQPGRAEIHMLYALALHGLERYQDSVVQMEHACALEPTVSVRKQLAAGLIMACHYPEAIALYEEMLHHDQVQRNEVVGNYACALAYAGRLDEALGFLDEALSQHSFDPALRMMRAIIHLLNERYGQGWDDYEWRNFSNSRNYRVLPFAKWRGEPLKGKRIVVLAEQGIGDQVMFASCIEDLTRQGCEKIVVEAMHRVAKTLTRSLPNCEVISTSQKKDMGWAADVQADYYVPLADLPKHFRRERAAFPGQPFLRPDPERQAFWRQRLAERGPRPWIGVSWKGGTEVTRTVVRTAQVSHFCKLARDLPGTWVSLQYGPVQTALEHARAGGLDLCHWPEAIEDLDEFAALVSVLDLVVTVCNTTVHYAGALGRPTLVLAPDVPEWRYGLHFERMPWYSDVTVLRQSTPGDWDGLFQTARLKLESRLKSLAK